MSRDEPFNNPFRQKKSDLTRRVKQAQQRAREEQDRERQEALAREALAREAAAREAAAPDDAQQFRRAMADVTPLSTGGRVALPREPSGAAVPAPDGDAEVYARLADLVAGHGTFEISDTFEYVEGLAPGVDRRLLKRLRRGDFSVQAHLDLHGLTRSEAREAVGRFLTESRTVGRRSVLLVHGRGLNSKDQVPVLKNALVSWLSHGRLGRRILAFATARPVDGGAGALYVLLRK